MSEVEVFKIYSFVISEGFVGALDLVFNAQAQVLDSLLTFVHGSESELLVRLVFIVNVLRKEILFVVKL